jgi:ketosteroid isomerase-like protein
MRWLVASVALAAACAHGHGTADVGANNHMQPAVATPKDVVAAARSAIERWRQAYEVKSIEALSELYAHDPDTVVVLEGQPLIGWSSVEAALKDRLARADAIHVTLKDVQIASIAPTVAHLTATLTREIQAGAMTVTEHGTVTVVMEKRGDVWLIVAEHYSYKHA